MIPSTYQNQDNNQRYAPSSQSSLVQQATSHVAYFWLLLISAIIGGGTNSVFYFYIQTECQLLKASWQMLTLTIAIIPFAFVEHSKRREDYIYSQQNLSNKNSWEIILWSSLGYSVLAAGSVIALNHAGVAHITPFLSLCPIIILLGKVQQGIDISSNEKIGIAIALVGISLLIFDRSQITSTTEDMVSLQKVSFSDKVLFGDLTAIMGAIGGAFFFIKNQELKNNFPFYFGALMTAFFSFLELTFAAIMLEDATISFDSQNGILGVFSPKWFWLFLMITLIAGLGGYLSSLYYITSFNSFSIGLIFILQPITSTIIISIFGWQTFPGFVTILGGLGILLGVTAGTVGLPNNWTKKTQTQVENATVPLIEMR